MPTAKCYMMMENAWRIHYYEIVPKDKVRYIRAIQLYFCAVKEPTMTNCILEKGKSGESNYSLVNYMFSIETNRIIL